MKSIKEIAKQLKRIADSLMMIEVTLLKINELKYSDIQNYAKDYSEKSQNISEIMEESE